MEYTLIRSSRKTIAIQIKDGKVIVRAPYRAGERDIRRFVDANGAWIDKKLAESAERAAQKNKAIEENGLLTMDEIRKLANEALKVIPERVKYYAGLLGVNYGRITIRNQRSKWGSCSAKGNLNFNCLLMLTPPEVLDSVVVHELCHRFEMNHSDRFYARVLSVFPNYYECRKWLRENGDMIMGRMRQSE